MKEVALESNNKHIKAGTKPLALWRPKVDDGNNTVLRIRIANAEMPSGFAKEKPASTGRSYCEKKAREIYIGYMDMDIYRRYILGFCSKCFHVVP